MISILLDTGALERLIGGNSEAEVKLRNGVVAEFAKRHFKAVLYDESFQEFMRKEAELIRVGLNAHVHDRIGDIKKVVEGFSSHNQIFLREGILQKIQAQADLIIGTMITNAVNKAWEDLKERLDRRLTERLEYLTNDYINTRIREKLDKIQKAVI